MSVLFKGKAPAIMRGLMSEFDISHMDAAAILGNLGHESGGFLLMQEVKPAVEGSRGGWGWAQWTGPRRRAFEAWADKHGFARDSDKANYGFLVYELKTTERHAIPAVQKAETLKDKTIAFELAFERAGVKHYDSRVRWAQRALDAYLAGVASGTPVAPPQSPVPKKSLVEIIGEFIRTLFRK